MNAMNTWNEYIVSSWMGVEPSMGCSYCGSQGSRNIPEEDTGLYVMYRCAVKYHLLSVACLLHSWTHSCASCQYREGTKPSLLTCRQIWVLGSWSVPGLSLGISWLLKQKVNVFRSEFAGDLPELLCIHPHGSTLRGL